MSTADAVKKVIDGVMKAVETSFVIECITDKTLNIVRAQIAKIADVPIRYISLIIREDNIVPGNLYTGLIMVGERPPLGIYGEWEGQYGKYRWDDGEILFQPHKPREYIKMKLVLTKDGIDVEPDNNEECPDEGLGR